MACCSQCSNRKLFLESNSLAKLLSSLEVKKDVFSQKRSQNFYLHVSILRNSLVMYCIIIQKKKEGKTETQETEDSISKKGEGNFRIMLVLSWL